MTEDTNTAGNKMDATLAERGSRYGSWRLQSAVTQQIKRSFIDTPNWDKLPDYLRETLDQAANKIARILSGDFMYDDNLHDLVGYFKLAEECLIQDVAAGKILPHELIDPLHFDPERVAQLLIDQGYVVSPPPGTAIREGEVADPAFLNDPVRASGVSWTEDPPNYRGFGGREVKEED